MLCHAIVAHAGGMGWDEAVIFAIPIVILAVLQILGRRKARGAAAEQDGRDEEGADG
jgi:hypothetical protein